MGRSRKLLIVSDEATTITLAKFFPDPARASVVVEKLEVSRDESQFPFLGGVLELLRAPLSLFAPSTHVTKLKRTCRQGEC